MKRRLFNFAAAVSMTIALSLPPLWAWSLRRAVMVEMNPTRRTQLVALSDQGQLELTVIQDLGSAPEGRLGLPKFSAPTAGLHFSDLPDLVNHGGGTGWYSSRVGLGVYAGPQLSWLPSRSLWLAFPHWSATPALILVAWGLHRLARPRRPGFCPRCGYDLRASSGGACPECGAEQRADTNAGC